ncbi:KHG/KDPG aldolase [Nymphon striatum]|nr:KHG/KDPG aldolase [Nymphon striatum]
MAPVVPVLVIHDVAQARPLAEALIAGGLPALEVTLRTPVALDAIREMAKVEGGVVGAGTLLTPNDVKRAKEAGATFGVSPGSTDVLLDACEAEDMPLLPGVATSSEAMRLLERGYTVQKFFPAEANGGVPALKSNRLRKPTLSGQKDRPSSLLLLRIWAKLFRLTAAAADVCATSSFSSISKSSNPVRRKRKLSALLPSRSGLSGLSDKSRLPNCTDQHKL